MGTMGRIEQRMDRDGGVLRDIKVAVEKKTAHTVLCGGNWEGSVLTAYTNDDTGFWKGLRRDLIKDGLPSAAIKKHKHLIQEYVKELGARGILDDESSKENNEPQHDIHANFDITEEIQEPFNNCNATLNVPQTYEHNIDVQPFEDLTEQSLNEYVNDTITEDVGSESPRAESCPKGSQSIKEQLCSSSDHTGIRMGAKDKSEFDYNNSNALEPLSTDSGPRNLHSAKSVPLRPAKKQSWTSRNETNTNRNDASKAGDAERAIQNDATNHASSHDGYFPQSIAELRRNINFVVTPAGVCHKADMSLLYKNFGQRSKVMLECLPDPSLQVPQTEPGDNPYYAADVEIIANIAQSAQKIIRDMCDCCIRPPVSLIDFRPRHFIDAVNMRPYYQDLQQFYISIHEVIADFDRQFCDIVQRIRRYNAKMKSGYPRYTTPAYPSFTHKDAYDNVPGQQHPSQMYSGGTGEDISSKHSVGAPYVRQGSKPINRTRHGYPVPLKSSNLKSIKMPSNTSDSNNESDSEVIEKNYSPSRPAPLRRTTTFAYIMKPKPFQSRPNESRRISEGAYVMEPEGAPYVRQGSKPINRTRHEYPVPLKSSNLKSMKMPSNTSDNNNKSDSEMTEENYPPSRPAPLRRTTTFAYIMEPEPFQSRPNESRWISERPSMGSWSTRTPPVARAVSSAFPLDERRPGLGRYESARAAPLKNQSSGRSDELFGENWPHDKTETIFGRDLRGRWIISLFTKWFSSVHWWRISPLGRQLTKRWGCKKNLRPRVKVPWRI